MLTVNISIQFKKTAFLTFYEENFIIDVYNVQKKIGNFDRNDA